MVLNGVPHDGQSAWGSCYQRINEGAKVLSTCFMNGSHEIMSEYCSKVSIDLKIVLHLSYWSLVINRLEKTHELPTFL